MRLPWAPASVSKARRRLQSWLSEQGGSLESVEDARVVVSELVANSVRHAQPLADGSILVEWRLADPWIELSVTDGGSETRPRNVHAPPSAPAGRGMAIVEVLAHRWWAEHTASKSTVHALLRR
jgi:anti-sigma regulatory factor (Ser/Thr protein kinase)